MSPNNIRERRMIRTLSAPSFSPASELNLLDHSWDQRIENKLIMISPESPGPASPNQVDVSKPSWNPAHKPIRKAPLSPPKSTDNRIIRFAKQQRIKPISNSFLASDTIRSSLWHAPHELEERTKHWKNDEPTDQILEREEGSFFLQMVDCCIVQQDADDWSPQQGDRAHSAVQAVLQEQGRQNKQQEWIRLNSSGVPNPPPLSHAQSNPIWSGILITKEEKERLRNQDQTPLFMIALQYSWHTNRATEAAKNRAIQLAMEIKRLWKDDTDKAWSEGEDPLVTQKSNHEEKKEDKVAAAYTSTVFEAHDVQQAVPLDDNDIEEVPLNDESSRDPRSPIRVRQRMSSHSEFSDLRELVKRGSSRSFLGDSKELLLDPENYLGDKVHLVLPSKVKAFPKLSAMLKKQRSRARLSARSLSLKEDIQVNTAMRSKRNVLKDIDGGKEERKQFFQNSVRKLITLNRFFQQVEGVSKDRALETDKKKFLAAIASKKSNIFQSMVIPDNLDELPTAPAVSPTNAVKVQSILLTPAMKADRPKHNVVWGEKLHRVKFFPEFPVESEVHQYFYSSEDISRFRFEKFMEDHNDEYEEEVVDSDDDEGGQLDSFDEDDEYSYEEISYHSGSEEGSYYSEEEEVDEEPAKPRDYSHLFETQSVGSDGGRRLSL